MLSEVFEMYDVRDLAELLASGGYIRRQIPCSQPYQPRHLKSRQVVHDTFESKILHQIGNDKIISDL